MVKVKIVEQHYASGMGKITRRMVNVANYLLDEAEDDQDLFSSIKDPISRWIFNEDDPTSQHGKKLPIEDLFSRKHSVAGAI